jgi:hypothetical protein
LAAGYNYFSTLASEYLLLANIPSAAEQFLIKHTSLVMVCANAAVVHTYYQWLLTDLVLQKKVLFSGSARVGTV